MYKFESIFVDEDRYEVLNDLVSFVTDLPGITPGDLKQTTGWLDQKIHQSSSKFPGWDQWTTEQRHQFEEICGPMMKKLGYKFL
jgi:hypothetical protein